MEHNIDLSSFLIGSAVNLIFWVILGFFMYLSMRNNNKNKDGLIFSDNPLIFIVKNTTNEKKTARLFGFSAFYQKGNFGSDEGITIQNDVNSSHSNYAEAVSESAFEPFQITWMKLYSKNKLQLVQDITAVTHKACTKRYDFPIDSKTRYMDKVQKNELYEENVNEFTCNTKINHSVYIEFEVLPNTQVNFFIFRKSYKKLDKAQWKVPPQWKDN